VRNAADEERDAQNHDEERKRSHHGPPPGEVRCW